MVSNKNKVLLPNYLIYTVIMLLTATGQCILIYYILTNQKQIKLDSLNVILFAHCSTHLRWYFIVKIADNIYFTLHFYFPDLSFT